MARGTFATIPGDFARLERDGFVILSDVISAADVRRLIMSTSPPVSDHAVRDKAGRVYAIRNLLTLVPAVAELARSQRVRTSVEAVLGPDAVAVRAIWFDKTAGANWKVAWHQDRSIAVREHIEVPGLVRGR